MGQLSPTNDRDLISISEARALAQRAKQAQQKLAEFSQERIDAIVDAMASAAADAAEQLAVEAVDETGYGVTADKIQKNLFAARKIHAFIRNMKTVGVIRRFDERKVIEIAEPFGVVAAVVPSTNPTSTAIFKILIAVKARCAIVISPHPSAIGCITRTADLMANAAHAAGAPEGTVNWMTAVTLVGTQELMSHRDVAVILATGGMGLVRAAYSAGKPAYGVGPGNAPAYIETSADVRKAVSDITTGKTFDNGVLCSSENSVVVDEAIAEEVRLEFKAQRGYFLTRDEISAVSEVLVTPQRLPNPSLVGTTAIKIASKAGIEVPPETRVLLAELEGVGRDYPLSIEKLCPVLSFYVVEDWHAACARCKEILRYGGMGHTMSIHSNNEDIILEFGLKKPAFRIVVNTPTTHGSIGLTTGLDPSMTLGCGGFGGNITSDNISPMHLLNIKRLAYGVAKASALPDLPVAERRLPQADRLTKASTLDGDTLADRIDTFLATRNDTAVVSSVAPRISTKKVSNSTESVEFVCEDDVRRALQVGQTILVDSRTIITPAARDLGEENRIFVHTSPTP